MSLFHHIAYTDHNMRLITASIFTALLSGASVASISVLQELKIKIVKAQIKSISNFLRLRAVSENSTIPLNNKNFSTFLINNMEGPISSRAQDPWGKPYRIHYSKNDLIIISSGPDTALNTPDDITERTRIH